MRKLITGMILAVLTTGPALAGTLSPGLEALLNDQADDAFVTVLVVMKDQPDIAALDRSLSQAKASRAERNRTVVATLQDAAKASGARILPALAADKAGGDVLEFRQHWLINAIVLRATVAKVRELALRDDVERIEPNLEVELVEPVNVKPAAGLTDKSGKGFLAPGLTAIGVPRVWHELGIDGTGTLVANLDSGVDVNHSALSTRWRGRVASASACWLDGAGNGSPYQPVDYIGHGTHVMGTITGVSDFDTVGVAPGAMWIASNNVASGAQSFDNAVLEAFEWFVNPDGDLETMDDVPDVIQNSWGVTPSIGPYLDCDSRWWDALDNAEAAGIVLVWSAGNNGPAFSSTLSPANRCTTPTNSFSVGSTLSQPPYAISNFSSRGPSQCGGPFAIKPEVCAPGSDIISTYPDNQYAYMSGTSMAGPHVAGVVALMRQANPDIEVTTIKEILMETAADLGSTGEDNTYGHGLIDAYAAVLTVLDDVGSVAGIVTDSDTGLPVAAATIREVGGFLEIFTDADGAWDLTVRAGENSFLVEKFGYVPTRIDVDIPAGGLASGDLQLPPTAMAGLYGMVLGPDGQPMSDATIIVHDTPVEIPPTDAAGAYSVQLPIFADAAYELVASAPGLAYDLRYTGLQVDTQLDFQLTELQGDGFETDDFSSLPWRLSGDVVPTISSEEAHEGSRSVRSGAIDHEQSSELALDYYINGGGEVSFWYKTESEPSYDTLKFYIDGLLEASWSGETPWSLYTIELPSGNHELKWIYSKDVSVSYLRDAAWIDLVDLPGTGVQPSPQIGFDEDQFTAEIDAGTVVSFPFEVRNTGGYRLDFTARVSEPGAPAGITPTWVTVSPDTGFVHPGSTTSLSLTFNGFAAPASIGLHEALLSITSTDPDHPDTTATLTLTVHPVSAVGDELPTQVQLSGAVPNPFNPSTSIAFSLPGQSDVVLRVYDVSGRVVRTLLNTNLPGGSHEVRWDGCDEAGRSVASGVFFARLQAGGQKRITPMTLIR